MSTINVEPIKNSHGWTVEEIHDDGEIDKANFYGPNAQERAERFAAMLRAS